jgi:outer membrane cobalamin receptor
MNLIKQIEIIRGPASALYGSNVWAVGELVFRLGTELLDGRQALRVRGASAD